MSSLNPRPHDANDTAGKGTFREKQLIPFLGLTSEILNDQAVNDLVFEADLLYAALVCFSTNTHIQDTSSLMSQEAYDQNPNAFLQRYRNVRLHGLPENELYIELARATPEFMVRLFSLLYKKNPDVKVIPDDAEFGRLMGRNKIRFVNGKLVLLQQRPS